MPFSSYTGNAMLNNALMTVEALGKVKDVSDITPKLLLALYQKHDLKSINPRLKNYTMLFTKNGPLHNDAKNGVKVYDALMTRLLTHVETDGEKVCEVSGLRFNSSFEDIFVAALKGVGFSEKDIRKKDTTLNRNWFPLIGGLGSDAQALPQAKFAIQIHPLCIAVMQFLPLSALLYRRGILLIDSSNFEFAKRFIAHNVKEVQKRIQATSVKDSIENIKHFSKGNYLLQAIQILEDKSLEEQDTDLNLWNFSNLGTGASCAIDRIPSATLTKLINLWHNVDIKRELEKILSASDSVSSYKFLESLENNQEWPGLYPAVFGSGKKRIEYEGVSVAFLEAYFKEIQSPQKIAYAKFLAGLINKYKTSSFQKYLTKTDAWNEKEFRTDLFAVIIAATRHGEWSLNHHCEILDFPDELPIKNFYYNIHRITHFYYLKNEFVSQAPKLNEGECRVLATCRWIIALIQHDEKKDTYFLRNFAHDQNYASVNYNELLIRTSKYDSVTIEKVLAVLFNEKIQASWFHLNELLRVFFNQKERSNFQLTDPMILSNWNSHFGFLPWKIRLTTFVKDYQTYYLDKYTNHLTGIKPFGRLLARINDIPNDDHHFVAWLIEATENVNEYQREKDGVQAEEWLADDLLYNPVGEISISFARFALSFFMHRYYYSTIINHSGQVSKSLTH